MHLNSFKESEYELLSSNWKLNKSQLKNAQDAVFFNFPHYSKHESSHSDTIIRNIESFLGEDSIKKLSPTDAWLILMAAYTHDLGMIVFHKDIESIWETHFIKEHVQALKLSNDIELRKAALLIDKIESGSYANDDNFVSLSLEIRQALILLIAEYYRKVHHERSMNVLKGYDDEFYHLLSSFHANDLPNRFSVILGEIAYAHGIDFDSILKRLEFEADGIKNDKMHPRFVACMLRLGDLLDVDDKRFNPFVQKVFNKNYPHTSEQHRLKHASTRHLLITPESIEITLDCPSDEVFRLAGQWFNWLEDEVQKQSREWSIIAPKSLQSLPPAISKGKLKILFKSIEPKSEFLNLRFTISNTKIFSIIEGGSIYENAGLVAIRELIQNSLDATKMQLWLMVNEGGYDEILRKHLKIDSGTSHEDILRHIKFPNHIPSEILDNFKILLKIDSDEQTDEIRMSVSDFGTGISNEDILLMTKKVGESKWKELKTNEVLKKMPYWLLPTGAFGLGLQSVFLLTPSFTVKTRSTNEDGKEIIFRSARNGDYCNIKFEKLDIPRGTTVSLTFKKEILKDILPNNFDFDLVNRYDYFTDVFDDIYLYQLQKYIVNTFSHVSNLDTTINEEKILEARRQDPGANNWDSGKMILSKEIDNMQLSVSENKLGYYDHLDWHFYSISESGYGSEISILFPNSLAQKRMNGLERETELSQFLIRNIPLQEKFPSFFKTSFCNVIWNLQSPASDTLLHLSRDRFLENKKKEISRIFLEEVFPKAIKGVHTFFVDNYLNIPGSPEDKATEYLFICITAKMNKLDISIDNKCFNDIEFPIDLLTLANGSPVKYADLFTEQTFIDLQFAKKGAETFKIDDFKSLWQKAKSILGLHFGIIVWPRYFLKYYTHMAGFVIKEIRMFSTPEYDMIVNVLTKENNSFVETDEISRRSILLSTITDQFTARRSSLAPIQPYAPVIAVHDWFDGSRWEYENRTESYIISPFRSLKEQRRIYESLKTDIESKNYDLCKLKIRNELSGYVPKKLVFWIIQEHKKRAIITDQETIENSYVELIFEMTLAYHEHQRS